MPELHRIQFISAGRSSTAKLTLDGHEIQASKVEISASVEGYPIVIITLPAAVLDINANAVVQLLQPVAV